jgi:hypothetical protein
MGRGSLSIDYNHKSQAEQLKFTKHDEHGEYSRSDGIWIRKTRWPQRPCKRGSGRGRGRGGKVRVTKEENKWADADVEWKASNVVDIFPDNGGGSGIVEMVGIQYGISCQA